MCSGAALAVVVPSCCSPSAS
ncbi:22.0 kDa class IV heat shock protein-like [Iris pallida]|uniref:22.0 kDa class IV heat shock protein-like n=1 Tax=Iris pallida TaxID=29817 RepID=A0AAX6FYD1_IRIPA|nr:22.0 kDa class IV heat shock protein-like [Iris pallida]